MRTRCSLRYNLSYPSIESLRIASCEQVSKFPTIRPFVPVQISEISSSIRMRTVGGPASSSTPLLPLKPRKSRQYRPNVILGRIIPLLLVFFAYHAALLVVYDSGYQLRIKSRGERVWGTIYLLHFGILFSVLAYSFGVIRLKERIRTPHDPPVAVLERSVVSEGLFVDSK